MANYLNAGDLSDVWRALKKRGAKLPWGAATRRVQAKWDAHVTAKGAHWWDVPAVQQRWNQLFSGDETRNYVSVLAEALEERFQASTELRVLSPGCGVGTWECELATLDMVTSVQGIDLSPERIAAAHKRKSRLPPFAQQKLQFEAKPLLAHRLPEAGYEVLHFHQSLHHFTDLQVLMAQLRRALAPNGLLVLHEYVGPNRLQFPAERVSWWNEWFRRLPSRLRSRASDGSLKRRVYAPGLWRMKAVDPSEAPESEAMLPAVNRYFSPIQEAWLGGDLLHLVLKDIAHHFVDASDTEAQHWLAKLLAAEDAYIHATGRSDYILGFYTPKPEGALA